MFILNPTHMICLRKWETTVEYAAIQSVFHLKKNLLLLLFYFTVYIVTNLINYMMNSHHSHIFTKELHLWHLRMLREIVVMVCFAGLQRSNTVRSPDYTESQKTSIPSEWQFNHVDPGRKWVWCGKCWCAQGKKR